MCFAAEEDINHLLCQCPVIREAWIGLIKWYGRNVAGRTWPQMVAELCKQVKGKKPSNRIWKALVTEFVYGVWLERNKCICKGETRKHEPGAAKIDPEGYW